MSTVYTTSHDPPRTAARGAEFTASTKADSRSTHPARTDRTSHALARPRAAQPYTRTLPYTRAPRQPLTDRTQDKGGPPDPDRRRREEHAKIYIIYTVAYLYIISFHFIIEFKLPRNTKQALCYTR